MGSVFGPKGRSPTGPSFESGFPPSPRDPENVLRFVDPGEGAVFTADETFESVLAPNLKENRRRNG